TAAYDHNYTGPLRNALEYLVQEWAYKPAGLVRYGGGCAGTRAAKALQGDVASLQVVTLKWMVNIPIFTEFIKEETLVPNEIMDKAADVMLKQLLRWSKGMKVIREDG